MILGILDYLEDFPPFVIYVYFSITQSNTSKGTAVKDLTDVI